MLETLDEIPWKNLTHAKGNASNLPDLIRALQTAKCDPKKGNPAIGKLYDTVCNEGSVYEAASFVVPFLLELAADASTPDRIGILNLMADIANGLSFLEENGDFLEEDEMPDNFEEQLAREEEWVDKAHAAVVAGIDVLMAITKETGIERYVAAHTMSTLGNQAKVVDKRLVEMIGDEKMSKHRAWLLLLMGKTPETYNILVKTLKRSFYEIEKKAAAIAIAWQMPEKLDIGTQIAVREVILDENIEDDFDDMPWNIGIVFNFLPQDADSFGDAFDGDE